MSITTKCKTKYLAKSVAIYGSVVFLLLVSAKMILAQENQRSVTIVPPSVEFDGDPGGITEGTLKVVNNSQEPLTFSAKVRDFVVEDTLGTPRFLADDTLSQKHSAAAWIAVSPDTFTIQPGKTQQLSYYLQVPADARPGGHYAGVVYEPIGAIGVQGTGTGVEARLGSLFYVTVSGDILENATVKKFAPENVWNEYGPITINSQIQNFSDIHIRPTGTIVIKNLIGQTIQSVPLEERNIYPEAVRDLTNTVGEKFMFGPYTAELRATYGTNNSKTLFASVTFFIIPWKIVVLVLLAIVVVALFVIFWRRRKRKVTVDQTPPPHAPPPTQPMV